MAFFIFECIPLFLLSLFFRSPFSCSLSLSRSFFSFFLLSCLYFCFIFALFWFLAFVSFFLFLFCFCSWKEQHQNILLQSFLIFVDFPLVFSFKSPLLIFVFFLILSFFVQHQYFLLRNASSKNTNFWSRGGLQHNGFLLTCVLQHVKSYRSFLRYFCQFLSFSKTL